MSPELLPAAATPELVFGLVAPIGVDLSLVSEILTDTLHEMHYKSHLLRVTELMREIRVQTVIPVLSELPSTQSYIAWYRERIAYANAVRARLGDFALAALAISAIRSFRLEERHRQASSGTKLNRPTSGHEEEKPLESQAYIIRQIKRPEEVDLLRQTYGKQFILISAYAPPEWRIRRLEINEKESRGGLILEADARNQASNLVMQDTQETEEVHGQNVRDAFPLGDVFIDATSRLECETGLRRFMHLLFGSNEITPARDEYGMYLAKSASLRSSDLSRQVGAAIFRQTGEVLTLGCNEVPKAGGGTYWPGDHADARDFVRGRDPNELLKTQVLVDLIDRLHKGEHLSSSLQEIRDPNLILHELLNVTGAHTVAESKVMDLLEFGRIVHAEMSALCDAARNGVSVDGATLYCTTFPCHICAKLIVAAGIKRVVYLEPYPKSYASALHGDAITVDSDSPEKRVSFSSFLGISPSRYRDLFERRRRKDSKGFAQRWAAGAKQPLVKVLYPSYFQAEVYAVGLLEADATVGQEGQ